MILSIVVLVIVAIVLALAAGFGWGGLFVADRLHDERADLEVRMRTLGQLEQVQAVGTWAAHEVAKRPAAVLEPPPTPVESLPTYQETGGADERDGATRDQGRSYADVKSDAQNRDWARAFGRDGVGGEDGLSVADAARPFAAGRPGARARGRGWGEAPQPLNGAGQ